MTEPVSAMYIFTVGKANSKNTFRLRSCQMKSMLAKIMLVVHYTFTILGEGCCSSSLSSSTLTGPSFWMLPPRKTLQQRLFIKLASPHQTSFFLKFYTTINWFCNSPSVITPGPPYGDSSCQWYHTVECHHAASCWSTGSDHPVRLKCPWSDLKQEAFTYVTRFGSWTL